MSTKIASLYAEIGADTSKFEQGTKKTKTALDQQAAAFAKFSADATRNAKSYLAYEAQKAKAIAATERAAAKLAKEEERAAKAAAKAAEARRKQSLVIAPGIEKGAKGIQEFTQANAGLLSVATVAATAVIGIGLAMDKTIAKVVEYGDQVQKLKTITGQSAEATSNTIQLADDARISYDKLAVSLQFASKKGVDTSINGLAKLSEEYKALAPGIERTKFLTDTFGKSGVEMGKILSMNAESIRNFKANAGQILTEEDLRNIKEYNHSLDSFKDKLESVGNTAGKALLPLKTSFLDAWSVNIRALDIMSEKHIGFVEASKMAAKEVHDEKAAFLAAGDGAEDLGEELDSLTGKQETAEETAKRLSGVYSGLLGAMFSIQKENDSYAKTTADLAKKDEELAAKKQQLTYEWYQLSNAGKGTQEAMLDYMKSVDEVTRAEAENAQQRIDLEADREKASKQREYDLAKERLSVDGLTASEFEGLQDVAVQKGLVSRAAADQAIAESQAADMIIESMGGTVDAMNQTAQAMMQIRALGGTVQFGVNFSQNVPSKYKPLNYAVQGADYSSSNPQASPGGYGYAATRDSGGPGMAGTPYMIGTGAQPEIFTPSTNGTFTPANQLGTTYNIVVNNPKKETAENSIRTSLKKLSYMGVAA